MEELNKNLISIDDIRRAYERIKPYIRHTPLLDLYNLNGQIGCKVYFKPEMLQYIGAFKLRGALNAVLSMSAAERKQGIITSSSGNHAQACAYVGQLLGIPVTVVVPEDAPKIKVENARNMGANVILWDRNADERWKKVHEEVEKNGYNIVHPYEDPRVMAGQGTIALEVFEDLPDVDYFFVPIGGGGLISGIATAVKEFRPEKKVIGVQAANSAAYYESRKARKKVSVEPLPTVADGLSCRRAGDNAYSVIERYVDDIVTVEESEIVEAVRCVANKAKLIAEPSSCVGVAALLYNKVKLSPDKKVATVLTAGNWDITDIGHMYVGDIIKSVE